MKLSLQRIDACRVLAVAMFVCIFAAPPASGDDMDAVEIFQHASPAVVVIEHEYGRGSGFLISADGWIITNFHVIDGIRRATVRLQDRRQFSVEGVAGVRLRDEGDLALLKIAAPGDLHYLRLDSRSPVVGSRIYAIGSPRDLDYTMSDGIVSGLRDGLWVQVTAPLAPGSSGGPVLNSSGRVIGVATKGISEGNLNFAASAHVCEELVRDRASLRRLGLNPHLSLADAIALNSQIDLRTHIARVQGDPKYLLNQRMPNGRFPLEAAVASGHTSVLDFLLRHGADPSRTGSEAFHLAASVPDVVHMRYLLEHGVPASEVQAAVCAAVESSSIVSLNALLSLDASIDLNQFCPGGTLPLHVAAEKGHVEVVKLLMASGADVRQTDEDQHTPLHLAALGGSSQVLALFIEHLPVDARTANGSTPLHYASSAGHAQCVSDLLAAGASVSAKRDRDLTPLHLAAASGHPEVARLLLAADAPVQVRCDLGASPLFSAVMNGSTEVVDLLFEAGATMPTRNGDGRHPLIAAASRGALPMIDLLIERGGRVNWADSRGATPLFYAAMSGHAGAVQRLLHFGADPNPVVVQGQDFVTPFLAAATEGHAAVIRVLADRVDVQHANRNGDTALHLAVWRGHSFAVIELLAAGANPVAKNRNGHTAIDYAESTGKLHLARRLRSYLD